MTINIKNRKSNQFLKRTAVVRIEYLLFKYKNHYDLESIWFNNPIDDITHYNSYPCYDSGKIIYNWYSLNGTTLMKILSALRNKEFFGKVKTTNGSIITIKPKKS